MQVLLLIILEFVSVFQTSVRMTITNTLWFVYANMALRFCVRVEKTSTATYRKKIRSLWTIVIELLIYSVKTTGIVK